MTSTRARSGRPRSLRRACGPLAVALAAFATTTLVMLGGTADPTSLVGSTAALFYVVPGVVVW